MMTKTNEKKWLAVECNVFSFLRGLKTLTALSLLSGISCTHPISENLRAQIDPNLAFNDLMESPNLNLEKSVMFGGVIVQTRNFDNHTEIEVIQKDLDSFGHPSREDKTEGRFIFVKEGFLEPEVYAKGRYITGAGQLKGTRIEKIDNKNYKYPLIEVTELKLWKDYKRSPYDGYYGPFYPSYSLYGYGPFRYFGAYGPFYPF